MNSTIEKVLPLWEKAYEIQQEMNKKYEDVKFSDSIYVYNSTIYASDFYSGYLKKYLNEPKKTLFVGRESDSNGTCQTGVPFASPQMVREKFKLVGAIQQENLPIRVPKTQPVTFLKYETVHQCANRLWSLFDKFYITCDEFFKENFILNYCALALFNEDGEYLGLTKLKGENHTKMKDVQKICDDGLAKLVELIKPVRIICLGTYTHEQVNRVKKDNKTIMQYIELIKMKDPSPLSPLRKKWFDKATKKLIDLGWQEVNKQSYVAIVNKQFKNEVEEKCTDSINANDEIGKPKPNLEDFGTEQKYLKDELTRPTNNMNLTKESILPFWKKAFEIQQDMNTELDKITFSKSIFVYNPTNYASDLYSAYLEKYLKSEITLFLGIQPGPYGACQTGIPFASPQIVKEKFKLAGTIQREKLPIREQQRNLVNFEDCKTVDQSGKRLWSLFDQFYKNCDAFFSENFIINYCALAFFIEKGKSDKYLGISELKQRTKRKDIQKICDDGLVKLIELIKPIRIICLGSYVYQQVKRVNNNNKALMRSVPFLQMYHPSLRSTIKDWFGISTNQLINLGWSIVNTHSNDQVEEKCKTCISRIQILSCDDEIDNKEEIIDLITNLDSFGSELKLLKGEHNKFTNALQYLYDEITKMSIIITKQGNQIKILEEQNTFYKNQLATGINIVNNGEAANCHTLIRSVLCNDENLLEFDTRNLGIKSEV